jgi:hypothetical protein
VEGLLLGIPSSFGSLADISSKVCQGRIYP